MYEEAILEDRWLSTREFIAYAKDHEKTKFMGGAKRKGSFVGEVLDAYFEFLKIPVLGNGFVMIKQIEEELGYDLEWKVLPEEVYKDYVKFDFVIHGKQPPEDGEI